ncbi:hypothetical protein GE09DRAFT_1272688 [Coniochaeta sp. 2T2.1]|nr:hypothetical protein GE09DRAFT_1272688 [Coniochaeta sp. 2T2.1]
MAPATIKTRILILSEEPDPGFHPSPVDILIHCGNLTKHGYLDEYEKVVHLLNRIDAQLKLVVSGDNGIPLTLGPRFRGLGRPLYNDLGTREYFASSNINVLNDGVHEFTLGNGTNLRVYAHSGTPQGSPLKFNSRRRAMEEGAPRGPRPEVLATIPNRDYTLADHQDIDIVITHGAPLTVLDKDPDGDARGSGKLMMETATARPLLHCFGSVPRGWGALLVQWGGEDLKQGQTADPKSSRAHKIVMSPGAAAQGYSYFKPDTVGPNALVRNRSTLFVNASMSWTRLAWVVDLDLPTGANWEGGDICDVVEGMSID